MSTRAADLTAWLRQRVAIAGSNGIVVGLSGGIDSAVVIRLAQLATDGKVVGVMMPCHSDPQDEADARLVADQFQVPTVRIDLAPSYDRLVADLRAAVETLPGAHGAVPADATTDPRARLPLANVKPRLRMATLYYVANSLNYL
ncbi:MAG TPA: NAD(+) synthase, partial [Vicinamibacterales bacterium]